MREYIPVITSVPLFMLGMFIAHVSPEFGNIINYSVSEFVEGFGYVAPLIIYLVLSSSLSGLISTKKTWRLSTYVIGWFAVKRLIACFWAIFFTALVFRFPLLSTTTSSSQINEVLPRSIQNIFAMFTQSTYFIAIWLAIITAFLAYKFVKVALVLDRVIVSIERLGKYMLYLTPVFMLAVGAYIYSLPNNLQSSLNPGVGSIKFKVVNVLGLTLDLNKGANMAIFYIVGSILIGVMGLMMHSVWVLWTKYKVRKFSLRYYFGKYLVKVYPLLWATSSESVANPLCLYLTKKFAPWVKKEIRRFVVVSGSTLDSNGTVMCVFFVLGMVAAVLGLPLSVFDLLLLIPLVFIIAYGIPGIPGELVIFAGPLATMLNVPMSILPLFLVLYSGLQIGLPDSFRTADNKSDDFLNAILVNEVYERWND